MTRTIKNRISNLEGGMTKQRTVWVWRDDYKKPTRYITRGGDITADELEALEADPTVQVVMFTWEAEYEGGPKGDQ